MGLTLIEFDRLKDELFARGFPKPDRTTGMYDLAAIDAWMDRRHPLTAGQDLTGAKPPRNAEDVWDERARRLFNG